MIKATLRNRALRKRASQFGRLVRRSAVTPLCGETHKPRLASNGELGVTFIGHSSFFVQIGGPSVVIAPHIASLLFLSIPPLTTPHPLPHSPPHILTLA